MPTTFRAVIRNGTIELLEPIALPEGIQVLVTVLAEDERSFWQEASSSSLQRLWDNSEDDIYADLLAS